jgi:phosphonate transport system ATP-binding protein
MSAAPAVLEGRGLVRRFVQGRGIDDVSIVVRRGEFVALVGPSGAGKTTLLRALAGLDPPDAGAVLRDGAPAGGCRRGDARVALVFQQPRLVGRRTVLANVLAGRLAGLSRLRGLLGAYRDPDRRAALEALEEVGLLDRADARTDRLSGGEQQRVAFARGLAQRPRVLLADEPIASLDPDNARRVLEIARDCSRRGLAVLASLHQVELAGRYADRLVRLEAGRIVP